MYFALSKLPILRTFVETERNHSSHRTVTSCGNFQSHSRIRGQNKTISATFAARNACSRSRRRKSLHVWYSPLVAKRKLVQHRLNTKYRPWTSSRENFCDIQLLKARCLICFLSIGILSGSPRCYFCPLQFYRPDLAAANWQQ